MFFISLFYDLQFIRGAQNSRCITFSLIRFYVHKSFAGMLNWQAIKFVNISENKVLANTGELTVVLRY